MAGLPLNCGFNCFITSKRQIGFEERARTFAKWPHRKRESQSAREMAASGFIYTPEQGKPDLVTCVYNGCRLFNWLAEDIPEVEHFLNFPGCDYVMNVTQSHRLVKDHKGVLINPHPLGDNNDKGAVLISQVCLVCGVSPPEVVLIPCAHLSVCVKCEKITSFCPACRNPPRLRLKVFTC